MLPRQLRELCGQICQSLCNNTTLEEMYFHLGPETKKSIQQKVLEKIRTIYMNWRHLEYDSVFRDYKHDETIQNILRELIDRFTLKQQFEFCQIIEDIRENFEVLLQNRFQKVETLLRRAYFPKLESVLSDLKDCKPLVEKSLERDLGYPLEDFDEIFEEVSESYLKVLSDHLYELWDKTSVLRKLYPSPKTEKENKEETINFFDNSESDE